VEQAQLEQGIGRDVRQCRCWYGSMNSVMRQVVSGIRISLRCLKQTKQPTYSAAARSLWCSMCGRRTCEMVATYCRGFGLYTDSWQSCTQEALAHQSAFTMS